MLPSFLPALLIFLIGYTNTQHPKLREEIFFSSLFVEDSVHHCLAPRKGDTRTEMAEEKQFMAAKRWSGEEVVNKQILGEAAEDTVLLSFPGYVSSSGSTSSQMGLPIIQAQNYVRPISALT